jgi:hypothetical protein
MERLEELTANEVRVLLLILGVDLDALGLERKDQAAVRAIVKKLRGREVRQPTGASAERRLFWDRHGLPRRKD